MRLSEAHFMGTEGKVMVIDGTSGGGEVIKIIRFFVSSSGRNVMVNGGYEGMFWRGF
jgi:hypothetical protein